MSNETIFVIFQHHYLGVFFDFRSPKTTCAATRKNIFQSTFLSAFLVISILVFALVLSSPFSITSFYEMVYLPDARPSNRPNLAFCLPMPFDAEKLRQFGLSNELVMFNFDLLHDSFDHYMAF